VTGPFPDGPRTEGDAVAEAARPRLWGLAVGLGLVVFGASFSYVPNAALRAVLLLGLVLGAAYLITRRLWLPIGIHALYNVVTALLHGSEETIPLVKLAFAGNPYWTSQAGVYALLAMGHGALAVVLILIAWKRGSLVSRRAAWGRQTGFTALGSRERQIRSAAWGSRG